MKPLELTKKQLFDLQFKYPEIDEIGRNNIDLGRYGGYYKNFLSWYENEETWNFLITNHKDKLTEEFLSEFIEQVTWVNVYCICEHYELSEEFMKKYKDYLYWPYILMFQKLSLSFLDEMSEYLNYLNKERFLPPSLLDDTRKALTQ